MTKKTELQKIRERHVRRLFWRHHKEDFKDFLDACIFMVVMYVLAVCVLCL